AGQAVEEEREARRLREEGEIHLLREDLPRGHGRQPVGVGDGERALVEDGTAEALALVRDLELDARDTAGRPEGGMARRGPHELAEPVVGRGRERSVLEVRGRAGEGDDVAEP